MTKIVLFGATGYTGGLVARALVRRTTVPVVLAGRDLGALRALADELGGPDVAAAGVGDDRLARLLDEGDVLVSTVGPFTTMGETAVRAAIARSATYLDCAGEGPFHRRVYEEWGPLAAAAGARLLSGLGADWVPGNVTGALALRAAGPDDVAALEIDYVVTGPTFEFSAGSLRTGAELMGRPLRAHVFRDGAVIDADPEAREMDGPDGPVTGHAASSTEAWNLPRLAPRLTRIDVHLAMPPATQPTAAGPDAESRSLNAQHVAARAYDADGDCVAEAAIHAANGYDYTGDALAWAADAAAHGRCNGSTGAVGPVEVFGLDAWMAFHDEIGVETTTWIRSQGPTQPSEGNDTR